jgi:hypothetical protein
MICAPDSCSAVQRVSGPVFMFCAPRLVFGGTEPVGYHFHLLHARTCLWSYRGRRVPFSFFMLPDSFSAVPWASGPVFMLCAPGLILSGTEGVGSRFHVMRSRTRFRPYRGRRVRFSCFERSNSFSAEPRASGPVFMFCALGLVFGRTDGVGSRFHVWSARTRFLWYHGCRVPLSCSALPDSFSAVPVVSGPVFMISAPGLVFGGPESVGSRFRWYRGRPNPFSYLPLPDKFSAVLRMSDPVFMFSAPGLVFSGTKGVPSRFHVFCSRTCVRRYRGRPIPFSCFPLPDMILAVPRATGPVFMFWAPELVFGDTEGV